MGEFKRKRCILWIWAIGVLGGGSGDEGTYLQTNSKYKLTTKLNK